jgi:hypothetical protein
MKKFKVNKRIATGLLFLVTAFLFILGHGHAQEAHGIALASGSL